MNNGNPFFDHPILNSPYSCPERHWELDDQGQPTQKIIEHRRAADFITPIPKPKKRKGKQTTLVFDEGLGLSSASQQYNYTAIINAVRNQVDKWRRLPSPNDWRVTPETARLLQHWRHHNFSSIRPFFCQVEAVETAIWLTEVAPQVGKAGEGFLEHLTNANNDANPELMRLALPGHGRLGEERHMGVMGFGFCFHLLREVLRAGMLAKIQRTALECFPM
jgi:type III restriction enzyme